MEMAALGYSDCRDKVFRPEERAIVARVIRFGGRTVRYIMTPRHKVQWLDSNESPEALLKLVGASKHAFLPVMCGDTDEVLGVVDLRELLWRYQKTGRFSLEASVVPVPHGFRAYRASRCAGRLQAAPGSDGHRSGRIRERRRAL